MDESIRSSLVAKNNLEEFILVMKEELDEAHAEIAKLKVQLAALEPPPIMFCIQGGDISCRFFLSVLSYSHVELPIVVSVMETLDCFEINFVERKIIPDDNYKFVLELCIICTRNLRMSYVCHMLNRVLDEHARKKIICLENMADFVGVRHDIQTVQQKINKSPLIFVYEREPHSTMKMKLVNRQMDEIPHQYYISTRREFPILDANYINT